MTPIKDLPLDPKTDCLKRFAQNGVGVTIVGQIAEQSEAYWLERKASTGVISNMKSGLKSLGLEFGYLDIAYSEVDRIDNEERLRKEAELQKQKEEQEKIVNTQAMYYDRFKKKPKP